MATFQKRPSVESGPISEKFRKYGRASKISEFTPGRDSAGFIWKNSVERVVFLFYNFE